MLESKNIDECIAIEGYCALHLINDELDFQFLLRMKLIPIM